MAVGIKQGFSLIELKQNIQIKAEGVPLEDLKANIKAVSDDCRLNLAILSLRLVGKTAWVSCKTNRKIHDSIDEVYLKLRENLPTGYVIEQSKPSKMLGK